MRNDDNDRSTFVLKRTETNGMVDTKPFETNLLRSRPPAPQASIGTVIKSKLAQSVEQSTTVVLQEIEKQAASIRGTTTDLTIAYRTRVDTAVYVEERHADFLDAKLRQQRTTEQAHIDNVLSPKQLELQAKKLERAAAEAEAAINVADQQSRRATEEQKARKRAELDLEEQRLRRTNELEEAEHRLRMVQLAANHETVINANRAPDPEAPAVPRSGDWMEAVSIAEDIADGHVLCDVHHLYHGLAGLLWLGCMDRGVEREAALEHVAARVLDRQQRHPLNERDARMYHQRYLDAVAVNAAKAAEEEAARKEEQERAAAIAEAKMKLDAEVKKAQMERDAALARERAAKTFVDVDDFDPKDDDDAN